MLTQGDGRQDMEIDLKVGDVRFKGVKIKTLRRVEESMLGRMFALENEEMLGKNPEDGSVFIEGDGEVFKVILEEYLLEGDSTRMRARVRGLGDQREQEAMMEALDYYGLKGAVFPPCWIDRAEKTKAGPNLITGRYGFGAAVCGGHVYIFGGYTRENKTVNPTEVIDLVEMSVTQGAKMGSRRSGCAAVTIDGERILVVGGFDDNDGSLNTTEILDVNTGVFTPGPTMGTKREGCALVVLDAHRVLVLGGEGVDGGSLATTEVLDSRARGFTPDVA